jgi:transporter family protein
MSRQGEKMWKFYALLSALFAALTAILAKIGIKGINGNIATAIRTLVVLVLAWGIVFFSGQFKEIKDLSRANLLFLVFSGIATGLSWIFYFKALEDRGSIKSSTDRQIKRSFCDNIIIHISK